MVGFDGGQTLAQRFRTHFGDRNHLYGYLARGMADDLEAGGPVSRVVRGYEQAPPGSVIQLRLLAGIFRLVLTGRAPELRPYYPCLGGQEPPETAWAVTRPVVADHVDELHAALAVAPQTNEVGRSAALLVGLFDVAAPGGGRIRLLELGASAGLHQLLAHFHIAGEDWSWGPADSPVQLPAAVQGPAAPVPLEVVSADGCDLDPVDATSAEGRLRLTSFVWPFDLHRHERLAGALRLAAAHQPVVERASAASWLDARLDAGPDDNDALTVVWHSITQLYWPASEIDAVRTALNAYGQQHRLAEVAMEYPPGGGRADQPEVLTTLWSGDGSPPRERRLGTAHDHGIPVRVTGSAGG
jgi:hypothetical protein